MREKSERSGAIRTPVQLEYQEVDREVEQKDTRDITCMLQAVHSMNCKLEEMSMKISELSYKVEKLINAAMDIKDAAGTHYAVRPLNHVTPDDPQVEQLAKRIDDAVAMLTGNGVTPGAGGIGAPPQPLGGQVQDSTVLNPPPVDPNALQY